jgi:hypothetical protein
MFKKVANPGGTALPRASAPRAAEAAGSDSVMAVSLAWTGKQPRMGLPQRQFFEIIFRVSKPMLSSPEPLW